MVNCGCLCCFWGSGGCVDGVVGEDGKCLTIGCVWCTGAHVWSSVGGVEMEMERIGHGRWRTKKAISRQIGKRLRVR